jgi:hypothetical protein
MMINVGKKKNNSEKNLVKRCFDHHASHMKSPGIEAEK